MYVQLPKTYSKLCNYPIFRQVMFINLVFNAMKKDPAVNRVKAFIKRILQVT